MSLRTRLLLAAGAAALVALVIADVVTYQQLRSFLYNQVDQALETAHVPVEAALGSAPPRAFHNSVAPASPRSGEPPDDDHASPTPSSCPIFQGVTPTTLRGLTAGTFIEVRKASGHVVYRCSVAEQGQTGAPTPALPSNITGFVANSSDFDERTVYFTAPSTTSGGPLFRVRASVLDGGAYSGGQLVVAVPLRATSGILDRLLMVELAVTGAALVAALLLGWWFVRVGLRPLAAIEHTAGAITEGEFEHRVPGDDEKTEVGRLARAINVMLTRIESAFAQRDATEEELRASEARMRRFVADASHELRTPLAAVSAYSELFERGASSHPEDLARVMQGIHDETARMGHLVEDLLLLARLDEGRPLEREPVELVSLAAESVRTAATVAPQWPVRLDARHPVEVIGDHVRLRQVLDNLLANVREHTPLGTTAVVAVDADDHQAVVSVADNGPGLSSEQAAKVFERFYRTDTSRSRRHGGAGLGLSIVASIVHGHGGEVCAAPGTPTGSVFTVRLPLTSPADAPDAVPCEARAPGIAAHTEPVHD